jgi:23S rRNA (pseudouridine1915-N3)-methyltransferase
MFDITIVAVGTIKEAYWQSAISEYMTRLKPYARLKIIEVKQEPIGDTNDRYATMRRESERIQKAIPNDSIRIVLDQHGTEHDSMAFSTQLNEWSQFGKKITFIIGGALGLDSEIMSNAKAVISFSRLTFTHQIARVLLLEQLYRATTIIQGKSYHY